MSHMQLNFMKTMKGNYSLIPLIALVGAGLAMSVASSVRALVKSPDAVINRRGHPKPYEDLYTPDGTAVQYKLFTKQDYSKLKVDGERPKLD